MRALPKVSPWPFVGMAGMACLLFLYAASNLFLPWQAVAGLIVAWLVLFVLACRWFSATSRRPLWVAVAGFVLWFGVTVVGGLVLDWR